MSFSELKDNMKLASEDPESTRKIMIYDDSGFGMKSQPLSRTDINCNYKKKDQKLLWQSGIKTLKKIDDANGRRISSRISSEKALRVDNRNTDHLVKSESLTEIIKFREDLSKIQNDAIEELN